MMTLEKDFDLIFDKIAGLLVIDSDANILYMNEFTAMANKIASPKDAIGKNIDELLADGESVNKLSTVLRTRKPYIGEVYFWKGLPIISNAYPLFRDGKLIGAFEYDIFEDAKALHAFIRQLNRMKNENIGELSHKDIVTVAKYSIDDIVGRSLEIAKLKESILEAARTSSNVMIEGESGCGKELVANAIHSASKRYLNPFIALNCAAIPSGLFESELFGYEEGSFTGAIKGGKRGKAEVAKEGTLFLDEIDQLPRADQPKLLRFLQEREIMRVGGEQSIPVNVRVITATNKDLKKEVAEGRFREDLFYRLNVLEIQLPTLRERKEDLDELARFTIDKLNVTMERQDIPVKYIDDDVKRMLYQYDWPGNVRELQNVLERAMNKCHGETLRMEHFKNFIVKNRIEVQEIPAEDATLKEITNYVEKKTILDAYKKFGGNKTVIANVLGISRETLYKRLREYEIE